MKKSSKQTPERKAKRTAELKKWTQFFLNPHLLLCVGIAWMITNGWSYVFALFGTWLGIGWMAAIGTAYMGLLWLPFTPEKLITLVIAIFLLKRLYPGDEKTLRILREKQQALKNLMKKRRPDKPGKLPLEKVS